MAVVGTTTSRLKCCPISSIRCRSSLWISHCTPLQNKSSGVMFGGLHIEMAALKALGDLLENSGWTGALIQASLATPGTADSFLKASHVTRTRPAHQITACSLYLLQQKACTENGNGVEEWCNKMSLEDWCDERVEACPLFLFWSITLQLEWR